MSSHVIEELPRLLTGDATRDEVMAAADHLRTCPDCQQELVSAVVAHASLTSAYRFAPEVVATEISEDDDDEAEQPLPDLTNIFARAREEATVSAAKPVRRHRLLAVAASIAVLGSGGAAVAAIASHSDSPSSRTVALGSFDNAANPNQIGPALASIVIDGNKLRINASKLPRLDSKQVYELWLTDSARKDMQPVGQLEADNTAVLPVAAKVMSQYNDFEVSVQSTSELQKYSGKSVLRGQYG